MSSRRMLLLGAALAVVALAVCAQQPFATLDPPQPTEKDGKVEVTEFFWYGCQHCYHLEPEVVAWTHRMPSNVVFKRVPAVPSESWAQLARVFYSLEAMGLIDTYHQKVFDAVHRDRLNLGNKKVREEWLAREGIYVARYNAIEKSFAVESKLQRARQLTVAYKVDGVPRVVVAGKYYTNGQMAGGVDKVFPLVDQLVARARKDG